MLSSSSSPSINRSRSRKFFSNNSISRLTSSRINIAEYKNDYNYDNINKNRMKMMTNSNHKFYSSFLIFAYILLIIVTLKTTIVNGNNNICGATENFLFCNCDNGDNAQEAACFTLGENILANDAKWDLFAEHKSLKRLKLSGYNNVSLRQFPQKLFNNQTLRDSLHDVILSDLQFKTLPTGAFKNMGQVRLIEISLGSRMEIQENAFDNLTSLEKIVMTKNNITKLPRMFRNVSSLREIYFEDNNIVTFERGVFKPLKNLNYLTLDNNKIETLSAYYFDGLVELNSLDLRFNQIKHLPSRVFEQLTKLEILDLSHNQIEDIDEKAFVGLIQLKELQMKFNKLTHIGTQLRIMANLIEIDLDGNQLQALSKYSFHRPDQKRFVNIKIRDNQIYCNCQIFWLKDAFEMNPENRNYNDKIRCYLGQGQYSNSQTIVQYLMNNKTIEQCTIPLPPTMATIDDDDNETVPIETIDSVDEENEQIDRDLVDEPIDGDKNVDESINGDKNVDEPEKIEKIEEFKEKSFDNNNKNEPPQLNVAGFDRTNKDNGACSLPLWNSTFFLSLLLILYHCQ